MFSPEEADSNATPASVAAWPPLQQGVRAAWPVLTGCATDGDLAALQAYVAERSTSTALLARLSKAVDGCVTESAVFGSPGARKATEVAAAREAAVRNAAAAKAAQEMEKAKAVGADASAMAEQLAKSSTARLSRLAATESSGGLIVTTLTLTSPSTKPVQRLEFRTHRLAAAAVAPFLTTMEAAAATENISDLVHAVVTGATFLADGYPEDSECYGFGVLELYRHFFAYLYGTCNPGEVVQHVCPAQTRNSIMSAINNSVLPYETRLRDDVEELRKQRQQTDQLAACVRSITEVIQDYCVFFHLTMSVADGLSKRFYNLAAALHPEDGALYGTARFPDARHCILHRTAAGEYRVKTGRSAIDGCVTEAPCPAFSPESRMQDKVMPTATAGRVETVTQVLSLIIAPRHHIAAFVLLSALASLPLPAALDVAVTVSELQELYQDSATLNALVKAMWRGHLGEVWAQVQLAAEANLSGKVEPLMMNSVLHALMPQVRRSLCFQYASSRSVVDLAVGAAYLGLPGGADALQEELEPLIVSGRLPMRINAVDKRLTQLVPPSVADSRTVVEMALGNSRLGMAEMELALRQLAVRRHLLQPTSSCIPLDSRESRHRK